MSEINYCALKKTGTKKTRTMELVCNNPEDKIIMEKGLQEGRGFRKLRSELGYAGYFKKIAGEKHDETYCTEQSAAVQLHLGLKDGYSVREIMNALDYKKYPSPQSAHGYAIQKLWKNENYDIIVTPSAEIQNYRNIFLKHKDGRKVDVNRLWQWINDFKGRTEEEIPSSQLEIWCIN